MSTETQTQLPPHHPESKLQHDFALFMINFPYTRLLRYPLFLVYSPRGNDNSKVILEAENVIKTLELNLEVESGKLLTNQTVIIKEKNEA